MKLAILLALVTACGSDDECALDKSYAPSIEPANFPGGVTNPLFPLAPGSKYVYEGGGEHVEVTVTAETLTLLGVPSIKVHDIGTVNGNVIEDTFDYYAQDQTGTVWYMGEDTTAFEDGEMSTEGSWRAGVDGAYPGVAMPSAPAPGPKYRQEYLGCEAEDMGQVIAVDETVTVPAGTFMHCVKTEDTTPLEPDVLEHKFYCPQVGLVLTIDEPTGVREELISHTP